MAEGAALMYQNIDAIYKAEEALNYLTINDEYAWITEAKPFLVEIEAFRQKREELYLRQFESAALTIPNKEQAALEEEQAI